MLIPSIDLMGGKIVQLVQGDKKALEFDNFEEWIVRFSSFPLVQLIDLDAAMGGEPNASLIEFFVKRLPCQVGGGIRSIESAGKMLNAGAQRVILGSTLIQNGAIKGLMAGLPLEPVRELRLATTRQLIAAGGITAHEEIEQLRQMGVDAVVGMALYSGRLSLPDTIPSISK